MTTAKQVFKFPQIALKLALIALFAAPFSVHAQIPDEFKNLKVLPDSVSKEELMANMKRFTASLGVRCDHCHVNNGDSFSTFDFAADDKQPKKTARLMMQMTNDINGKYISQVGDSDHDRLSVQCMTCHRGQPRPLMTDEALLIAYKEGGADSAMSKYHQLRDEYYGSHTYDFSEMVLLDFAIALDDDGDTEGGIKAATLNLEYMPESSFTYLVLGHLYVNAGDTATAIANLNLALEKNPNNRGATRLLEQLEGK